VVPKKASSANGSDASFNTDQSVSNDLPLIHTPPGSSTADSVTDLNVNDNEEAASIAGSDYGPSTDEYTPAFKYAPPRPRSSITTRITNFASYFSKKALSIGSVTGGDSTNKNVLTATTSLPGTSIAEGSTDSLLDYSNKALSTASSDTAPSANENSSIISNPPRTSIPDGDAAYLSIEPNKAASSVGSVDTSISKVPLINTPPGSSAAGSLFDFDQTSNDCSGRSVSNQLASIVASHGRSSTAESTSAKHPAEIRDQVPDIANNKETAPFSTPPGSPKALRSFTPVQDFDLHSPATVYYSASSDSDAAALQTPTRSSQLKATAPGIPATLFPELDLPSQNSSSNQIFAADPFNCLSNAADAELVLHDCSQCMETFPSAAAAQEHKDTYR
jgi:hypothetical protein